MRVARSSLYRRQYSFSQYILRIYLLYTSSYRAIIQYSSRSRLLNRGRIALSFKYLQLYYTIVSLFIVLISLVTYKYLSIRLSFLNTPKPILYSILVPIIPYLQFLSNLSCLLGRTRYPYVEVFVFSLPQIFLNIFQDIYKFLPFLVVIFLVVAVRSPPIRFVVVLRFSIYRPTFKSTTTLLYRTGFLAIVGILVLEYIMPQI